MSPLVKSEPVESETKEKHGTTRFTKKQGPGAKEAFEKTVACTYKDLIQNSFNEPGEKTNVAVVEENLAKLQIRFADSTQSLQVPSTLDWGEIERLSPEGKRRFFICTWLCANSSKPYIHGDHLKNEAQMYTGLTKVQLSDRLKNIRRRNWTPVVVERNAPRCYLDKFFHSISNV
jgi:hypothetical protein